MKSMRRMSACIVVAVAVGAVASASASAAPTLPELGRCVPASPAKTGNYFGAKCLKPAAGNGNYTWMPGPGAKPKFEGTGTEVHLSTAGHTITCAANTFDGEYTGPKTAKVTLVLVGCIDNVATKQSCQTNPTKTGEIEPLKPLEAEIGFIKGGATPTVGIDLKGEKPLVRFECGKVPESVLIGEVEGSVIGSIGSIDRMNTEFKLAFKATGGKQVPEQFEGGLKDTLSIEYTSGVTKTHEEATLRTSDGLVNEEAMEIKAL